CLLRKIGPNRPKPLSCRPRSRLFLLVHGLAEDVGRVERHHAAGGYLDAVAGVRVPTRTRAFLFDRPLTEARDLDLFAGLQLGLDLLEYDLKDFLGLLDWEAASVADPLNQDILG